MTSLKKTPPQKALTPQSQLPAMLGIGIDEVRRRRGELQLGQHWCLDDLGRVLFTEEGVDALKKGLHVNGELGPVQKMPLLLKAAQPLKVWRCAPHIRNQHIIEVYFADTDPLDRRNIFILWVKDQTPWRVGLLIQPGDFKFRQPGQYDFTGRAPRRYH